MRDLTVFISYSWDSQEHKEWVRKLADYLIKYGGINVILDQYDLAVGNNMTYFMESAIERANKVLIILTPVYKMKADSRSSGVGFEHSIISSNLFETQKDNTKFIPVLRSGSSKESSPVFIKSLVYYDMSVNDRFESDAFTLSRILYDEPSISKPVKGEKPNFNIAVDPILEQAKNLAARIEVRNSRLAYSKSFEAPQKLANELVNLFAEIESKAEEYKKATTLFINSEVNENKCILNINGIGMKLVYNYSYDREFEQNELVISIWDKSLYFKDRPLYFPGEEPKQLWSVILKPQIKDNLELEWVRNQLYNPNNSDVKNSPLTTKDLNGYCYSTLFEWVKKKRA
ncbi:toll/interleukin-1 receptor domain-containing protein [Mucilaginibacter sp. L3T2-6]|uniref:toll/interleukin-1 receptor domain-containing protein n=1 Tax=Mucilaginibacter sp. L3T2-6 TaxID=3062491 RepID=UPI0026770A1D|nr:toll/interleukin-1 receptor domain-containing protein [Mucilaginibacter sp. L3T2-6]MDO3645141.1 toll/interleukin-1 receptor domain-containing protein [Mucilaginibacter sp. L3T2-6]MDV6217593.1 toll/interleukin-1 receptor domain-containing protein [Mucilaginibacter sp. L3T2-6]